MSRFSMRPALFIQRGLTLVELMIAMTLGLIVVGGVLGIFVANSETQRRTDELSRIQENARVAMQLMGRSMREAGGNPCGIPSGAGLILHMAGEAPTGNWWSGGNDFTSALIGYVSGDNFPAIGSTVSSDAVITVSANASVKIVINDTPPGGAMIIPTREGLAAGNILFACNTNDGRGMVFRAGAIAEVAGTNRWSVSRTNAFSGAVATMRVAALGRVNAEGWFVDNNGRGGTSLFRAFNGGTEEIATDVSAMRITYLLPGENQYVTADQIINANWPRVIAAYVELDITSNTANPGNPATNPPITRTVGLTINLRNR